MCIIGWSGFVRMSSPKRCKKSRIGSCLSISDASEVSPEPRLSPRANSVSKSKAPSHPDPLPVKEFSSGASEHGFVRPPNCVPCILFCSYKQPEVFSDEAFTDRKSTFQAHCAEIHSEQDAKLVLEYLYSNNKIQR